MDSRKIAGCALLIAAIFHFVIASPAMEVAQAPVATTAAVSGRIVLEGKPLSGVRVFLISTDRSTSPKALPIIAESTSNTEGKYRLERVPPGAFTLTVEAGSYVLPRGGARSSPGLELVVRGGEDLANVNLELKPGAVITGRLRDSDGQPLIGQRISILRLNEKGEKQAISLGIQVPETDDRGVYRIYGLEAGKYVVGVSFSRTVLPNFSTNSETERPTTYYPGVTTLTEAVPIELELGAQFSNGDFVIAEPIKTHTAFGEVLNAQTGQPVSGIRVTYKSVDPSEHTNPFLNPSGTSDEKGLFRIAGIKPGSYVALVPASDNGLYAEVVPFEITTEDVSGLQLRLRTGSTIIGSVEVVSGGMDQQETTARLSHISVLAVDVDRSVNPTSRLSAKTAVQPDGSFKLDGLKPGTVKLLITSSPPQEFALLRTELHGGDRGEGIEVRPGETAAGVRLILVYGKGQLVGAIKTENGDIPKGAEITISATMNNTSPARRNFATTDETGSFRFVDLTPGDYELKVIMKIPSQEGQPQFRSAKQNVTIRNGETAEAIVLVKSRS